ncbi:hypothetical protein JTB14_023054 [Gonioctena quinquepunctata]|nr:hypothetical protein JTB14_023054 [Gonioctena quinquepunctata]
MIYNLPENENPDVDKRNIGHVFKDIIPTDCIKKVFRIGKKSESLIRTLREKEAQLEITERQKDDLAKELLEDLAKLKEDNGERDKFIHKLRRTSMDFEDEVASAEQNYITKLNEQKGIISEQKSDITNLIQKNTDLQEEIEELRVDLNRYQNDIADLSAINKNMLISFETMTQEKEGYIENLKKIKYDYACLKQDHNNMKLVQKKGNISKQLNLDHNLVKKEKHEKTKKTYFEESLQADT